MCPLDASDHGAAERLLADLLARAAFVVVQGFADQLRRRGASLPVWRVLAALLARLAAHDAALPPPEGCGAGPERPVDGGGGEDGAPARG